MTKKEKNIVIVFQNIGEVELRKRLDTSDVWIVKSPENDFVREMVRQSRSIIPFSGELTAFDPIGLSRSKQLENVLDLIDEHYGEYTDWGVWTHIEVLIDENDPELLMAIDNCVDASIEVRSGSIVLKNNIG